MSTKFIIPFYESPSDSHCFQACLKMVLGHISPDWDLTWQELDKISGHSDDKWTWQGSALLYLAERGYKVVNIENLDYLAFAKKGEKYLAEIWTPKVFDIQRKYSDLDREQKIAKKLVKNSTVKLINKEVIFSDIISLMENNYDVMVSINPYTIREEEGYSSHMVVVLGFTDNSVIWHDPGPPGKGSITSPRGLFEKSMTKPEKEDGNIIGIKQV